MEILVIHPGALGDIILSLPALGILRRSFPHKIALAGNIDYISAAAGGHADRLLSMHSLPLHRLFGSARPSAADLKFWRSFDRIISWTGAGDSRFEQNMAQIHRRVLMASWLPVGEDERHVSQIFVDSLRPWIGRREHPYPVRITLGDEARTRGVEWLNQKGWNEKFDLIALNPGAGSASKRWPLGNFRLLASELLTRPSRNLLFIDGPAEPGLGKELARTLPPSLCRFATGLPLELVSSVLICCRAYIGNDSGIAHLAAALGIPCLLIFGPTRPEHWAPLGVNVTVIRGDAGFENVSSSQVHAAAERLMP